MTADRWEDDARPADRRAAGPRELDPDRRLTVYASTWRPWLDETRPNQGRWSDLALAVLDKLPPDQAPPRWRDARLVDRHLLLEPSRAAASEKSDDARVRLLFATLLWGNATSNGLGPRYAAAALADPRLASTLSDTAALVAAGELAQAHSGSAFTASDLLLYQVVLGRWAHHRPEAERYANYVRMLADWSAGATGRAEMIEQLLFRGFPAGDEARRPLAPSGTM